MKIGVITFHWATNYGAVLQAYALKSYIESIDDSNSVRILNFQPYGRLFYICRMLKNFVKNFFVKECRMQRFRKKYLKMTKWFKSSEELKKVTGFDCYISGSDQIWNMWFIEFGEGKESYVYFLNFVPENKIIASYAASFGTEQCDERYTDKICSCLKRYDFISVRENTGQKLLESLNINNSRVVPDPTLLLESGYYEKLIKRKRPKEQYAFVYMLHDRIEDAKKAVDKFESKCFKIKYSSNESVENWLANIKYSSFVITNSFHGMVFAILFNVPFMVILVEASGMNDRIYTLLNKLGLESRIYDKKSNCIPTDDIDWKMVNEKLSLYRKVGCDFISEIINYEKG